VKEKFLLFLAACLILIILIPHFQPLITDHRSPESAPSQLFGQLLEEVEEEKVTTLIAIGDVMLGRSVNAKIRSLNDFTYPFLKTADLLKSADITFINLESPFYNDCPTTNTGMIFCADTRAVEGLVFTGIDIANLANNHIRNYGSEGISLTKTLLRENSITPLGPEPDLIIKEIKGIKFGFLGFDLTSGYQEEEIINVVKEKKNQVDILIVSFHWGIEYAQEPASWQIELAHQVIDAGAALILGHHPHVIQKTEDYSPPHQNIGSGGKGKIVYSLGNFVFDQPWSEATKKGLVGIFTFQDKKLVNSEFKEVYIQNYSQPEFID
jgi:poly-gamma-glutamate capsule biosynthesis protein CapA/YwtB (metallophosphatase superfamily)